MKYDVICDGCRMSFHETVEGFDPEKPAKGSQLRLKEPWRGQMWSSFPETDDYEYGSLECPGCGAVYGNGSGMLELKEQPATADELL